MRNILNEGLEYLDLVGQVLPELTVDKYVANMGEDADIVTLAFLVKGQQASQDLVDWFERGYEYVLDAQVSSGELSSGRYVVFAEMERRNAVPTRIVELLSDLKTLTDISLNEWTIIIDDESYEPNVDTLKQKLILSPFLYKQEKESELNEMREISGIPTKKIHKNDSILKDFIAKAGL
jgi:hypothetical protein